MHLFDDTGERRDKFKTKAADAATQQAYIVRGLAFSPDSTKLAVAQASASSSSTVLSNDMDLVLTTFFVHRAMAWSLCTAWAWSGGGKKSICNKLPAGSPITCVAWPLASPDDLFFGAADGKVSLLCIQWTCVPSS